MNYYATSIYSKLLYSIDFLNIWHLSHSVPVGTGLFIRCILVYNNQKNKTLHDTVTNIIIDTAHKMFCFEIEFLVQRIVGQANGWITTLASKPNSRKRRAEVPSHAVSFVNKNSTTKSFRSIQRSSSIPTRTLLYIRERYAPVIQQLHAHRFTCFHQTTKQNSFHKFSSLVLRKYMTNCCYCSELNEDLAFESKSN